MAFGSLSRVTVGCMSGNLLSPPTDAPASYVPTAVALVHGSADAVVSYDPSVAAAWARYNGCAPTPTSRSEANWDVRLYASCTNAVEVELLTLPNVGHHPHSAGTTPAVWVFLRRFTKPGATLPGVPAPVSTTAIVAVVGGAVLGLLLITVGVRSYRRRATKARNGIGNGV